MSVWAETLHYNLIEYFHFNSDVSGLLTSDGTTASHASDYLKELINLHIDVRNILTNEGQLVENEDASKMDSVVKSVCTVIGNLLSASDEVPSEHILAVVSVLLLKLCKLRHKWFLHSFWYRKDMFDCPANDFSNYLQFCIVLPII